MREQTHITVETCISHWEKRDKLYRKREGLFRRALRWYSEYSFLSPDSVIYQLFFGSFFNENTAFRDVALIRPLIKNFSFRGWWSKGETMYLMMRVVYKIDDMDKLKTTMSYRMKSFFGHNTPIKDPSMVFHALKQGRLICIPQKDLPKGDWKHLKRGSSIEVEHIFGKKKWRKALLAYPIQTLIKLDPMDLPEEIVNQAVMGGWMGALTNVEHPTPLSSLFVSILEHFERHPLRYIAMISLMASLAAVIGIFSWMIY